MTSRRAFLHAMGRAGGYSAAYLAMQAMGLLAAPRAARERRLLAALRPLVNAIRDDTMRVANREVDIDGLSPVAVAERLFRRLAAPAAAPTR